MIKWGNQVDGDKMAARFDAVLEDYKDEVLGGKLWKNSLIHVKMGKPRLR